jgi:type I restriction enzyme R subunit
LLDKYVEQGVESLEDLDALKVEPINQLGSPRQIMQAFGGRAKYDEALQVLEQQLYS